MSFAVVTDTSSNLQTPLLKELNISVLALKYHYDGNSHTCLDTGTFDGDDFYNRIRAGLRVSTSQIAPYDFIELFRPILEAGEDILFISMSSGISGTFNSSQIAANELLSEFPDRKIICVDTLAASLGEGLIAVEAAHMRDAGKTIEETAEVAQDLARRTCQVFTVDDLMHLRRGGRLSNISAIVGTVLQIKPLLKGNEYGQIVAFAKLRGRKRSIEAIAQRYDAVVYAPETQTVGIAHAGCREDAEYLAELLKKNRPPRDIMLVDYEPVTGSHVGPGALALFFLGPENARSIIE